MTQGFILSFFFIGLITLSSQTYAQLEIAELRSRDLNSSLEFGSSVEIDGGTIVICSEAAEDERGECYVYTLDSLINSNSQYHWDTILSPEQLNPGDNFGASVALSGNYLVVGASDADNDKGTVYVYHKNNNEWDLDTILKLEDSNRRTGGFFGKSVGISSNFIVVGAEGDGNRSIKGSAYLYKKESGIWQIIEELDTNTTLPMDAYGCSIAIRDSTQVFVGAPRAENKGLVYIFKSENNWGEPTVRDLSTGFTGFGNSMDISGDFAIIGAPFEDDKGAAYIYQFSGGEWRRRCKIQETEIMNNFGASVSISGDIAIVGATDISNSAGKVFVYLRNRDGNNNWGLVTILEQEFQNDLEDGLGNSIAISGDFIIAGASKKNSANGSASLFSTGIPTPEIQGDLSVCEGDSGFYASNFVPTNIYSWFLLIDGDTIDIASPNQIDINSLSISEWSISPSVQILLKETVLDTTAHDIIDIIVHPLPEVSFTSSFRPFICSDEECYLIPINPPLTGDGGQGMVFINGNSMTQLCPEISQPGVYDITYNYIDANGCMNTVSDSIEIVQAINVNIETNTGSTLICGDNGLDLTASFSPQGIQVTSDSITWLYGESSTTVNDTIGATPSVTVFQEGYYQVNIITKCGIRSSEIIQANTFDLFLPSLFTPGTPPNNERFRLKTSVKQEDILEIDWKIFNRNGIIVYETKKFDDATEFGWGGEDYPSGVYFYKLMLTLKDCQKAPIISKGKVTLHRY